MFSEKLEFTKLLFFFDYFLSRAVKENYFSLDPEKDLDTIDSTKLFLGHNVLRRRPSSSVWLLSSPRSCCGRTTSRSVSSNSDGVPNFHHE